LKYWFWAKTQFVIFISCMATTTKKYMSIVVILFLIIMGSGFLYATRQMRKENNLIESWPKTPGKILKSKVFSYPRYTYLAVEYEFFVNGVRHQSNKVHRWVTKEKTEFMQDVMDQKTMYSLGRPYNLDKVEFLKNPEVKYNPQDPTDCCLVPRPGRIWFLIAGILMLVIGVFGLLIKILIAIPLKAS